MPTEAVEGGQQGLTATTRQVLEDKTFVEAVHLSLTRFASFVAAFGKLRSRNGAQPLYRRVGS